MGILTQENITFSETVSDGILDRKIVTVETFRTDTVRFFHRVYIL